MSRRKTQAELDAEAELESALAHKRHQQQQDCSHWGCAPSEWWFSTGQVRTMRCNECGAENDFAEDLS